MPIIAWRTREHQKRARAKNTTHVDGRAKRSGAASAAAVGHDIGGGDEVNGGRKEDGNANKHFSAAIALRFPIFTIFCECENQEVTSSEQGASLPLCNHRRTRCSSVAWSWSWHFYLRANLRRIH